MRHGYGGKYLKELHKSALYQRQGFGKDACKFRKGIFFIFLCSRSNISPSSSAFSLSMEDLCVSAIKKQPTAQCHFLCDLCMPGALIFPWQKAEQALSLVENSKRRGVKVNNCFKKSIFSLFSSLGETKCSGPILSLILPAYVLSTSG